MDGSCYVKNLLDTLQCPVGFEPLHTAVNLFPCNHKVNEAAAKRLYGICVKGDPCEKKGQPCCVCRGVITSYGPDHTVRQLTGLILGNKNQLNKLPEHPLVLEERPKPLPYPGKPAIFVHEDGDWELVHEGTRNCREYIFKSITEDSLLERFSVLGGYDGKIRIHIGYSYKQNKVVREYFCSHGIPIGEGNFSYISETPELTQALFRILAENNEIPKEYYEKLRGIIEKGSIEPSVPPPSKSVKWYGF